MPKYYTPKAAIRFANQEQAAFKSMGMAAEVVISCVSDHSHKDQYYSGVIRFNKNDWKRYTVIWIYGTSVEKPDQDFIRSSITDISSSTYWENHRVVAPVTPATVAITGSNLIDGSKVFFDGIEGTNVNVISRNYITVDPPAFSEERESVQVYIDRPAPDALTSPSYYDFSYEYRPVITDISPDVTYNGGMDAISITGTYLKRDSEVFFMSSTWTGSSNNVTFSSSQLLSTFTMQFPATGTYNVKVRSPSGLVSSLSHDLLVKYHPPVISRISPYASGSVEGGTPLIIEGNYFLTGALVYFDNVQSTSKARYYYINGALSNVSYSSPPASFDRIDPSRIYVTTPAHSKGVVKVKVANPEDSQTSNEFDYEYIVPIPTITDANFVGDSIATRKTGSVGSVLYLTGTAFTGSDPDIAVTSMAISSGAFSLSYTVPDSNISLGIISNVRMSFSLPPGLQDGSKYDITVQNNKGPATLSGAFEFQDAPAVVSVNPSSGSVGGGVLTVIRGQPFYANNSEVIFGNVQSQNVTVNAIDTIAAITPQYNAAGGFVDVKVRNFSSVEGVLPNGFEYVPYPTASSVRGPNGGTNRVKSEIATSVSVIGSRFLPSVTDGGGNLRAEGTQIFVGASVNPSSTSYFTPGEVSLNVGPHAAGFIAITPMNRGVSVGDVLSNAIEFVNTPRIDSVSPSSFFYTGGTSISITGINFLNNVDTIVKFSLAGGGEEDIIPTSVISTSLSFIAPTRTKGTYQIRVVNRGVISSNYLTVTAIDAPVITSLTPNRGANSAGSLITVTGQNFNAAALPGDPAEYAFTVSLTSSAGTSPLIAPVSVSASNVTATSFNFYMPTAAYLKRGDIDITVSSRGQIGTAAHVYTMEQQPLVTSLSPSSVLLAGGTITVNGSGFINGVTTVWLNSTQIACTIVSDTQIQFTAPVRGAATTETVYVKNTFLSTLGNVLTWLSAPVPVVTSLFVNGYPASNMVAIMSSQITSYNSGSYYLLTISGSNFTNDSNTIVEDVTRFYFGSKNLMKESQSTTHVTFRFPAFGYYTGEYVRYGSLQVRTPEGVAAAGVYRFISNPGVLSVSPSDLVTGNYPVIMISASNYGPGTNVGRLSTDPLPYVKTIYPPTAYNPGGWIYSSALATTGAIDNAIFTCQLPDMRGIHSRDSILINMYTSSTIPDEIVSSWESALVIANPYGITSITPNHGPATAQTTVTIVPTDWSIYYDEFLRIFVDGIDTGLRPGITPGPAGGLGFTATLPPHPSSAVPVQFGYVNSLNETYLGSPITYIYDAVAPLAVSTTVAGYNYLTSSYLNTSIEDITSQLTVFAPAPSPPAFAYNTNPILLVTGTGGVPPYTAELVLEAYASMNTDGILPPGIPGTASLGQIVYGTSVGAVRTARWNLNNVNISYWTGYPAYCTGRYRWKITDSVGTVVYCSNTVNIGYAFGYYGREAPYIHECVDPNTEILMADGSIKLAKNVLPGDHVQTYPDFLSDHMIGSYEVIAASVSENMIVAVLIEDGRVLKCSHNHRVAVNNEWLEADLLEPGMEIMGVKPGIVKETVTLGMGEVIKLTVSGAHTYISEGLLSHNAKIVPP